MAKRSNIEEFVSKSRKIHGDTYIYDNVVYINDYSKVIITCRKHGNFEQIPTNHLRGKGSITCLQHGDFLQVPGAHISQGQGCPKCVCNVSRIGSRWLDSLDIPNDSKHREVDRLISGRKFVVDGYMPDTNTVYEFYGDKAHGNPGKFNYDDKGLFGVTYGESYRKTVEREHIFRSAGYNLVTIWESDYKQQLIREFVENQSRKALKKAS